MVRKPLTIIHEFSSEGYRRYLKGQKPGKWKQFETVENETKDDKTNDKNKSSGKTTRQ